MNLTRAMLEDYEAVQKSLCTYTDSQITKQRELIGKGFVGSRQYKHVLDFMLDRLSVYIKHATNEEYIKVATKQKEVLIGYISKLPNEHF